MVTVTISFCHHFFLSGQFAVAEAKHKDSGIGAPVAVLEKW